MKTFRYIFLFVVLMAITTGLHASEVSDKFAEWVGKMASDNDNDRKNSQQDWMKFVLHTTDAAVRKEACEIMIKQVEKADTPVETSVWLVRQIGYVGDDAVVPALAKFMKNDNVRIADEAARALSNIPTDKAAEALKASDSKLGENALSKKNIDRDLLKKTGDETLMPQAIPYAKPADVAAWMAKYDSLDDLSKARTLSNLIILRDKKYLPQALAAVKSENEYLRDAGLLAVGALGGTKEIPVLLDQCFSGANRDLAKVVLSRMVDRGFDELLVGQLKDEKDLGRFEVLADILSRRNTGAAKPIILAKAKAADCTKRLELARIAENLATKDDAGDFVDVWELVTDRGQKDQVEQVVARLVDGDSAPALAKRTDANYAAFFSLLGRIGDEKSLEEIRNRVFDRPLAAGMTASPELKAAALRAMCNWPDGKVAEDLLAVAESDKFNDGDRISALRGFARVASLPWDRIKIQINDEGKVELLGKGMKLARRVDEKRFIIQRVGQVRCVNSLKFVLEYFDDAELQDQVCQSILDLAHHTDLRRRDKDAFTAALEKVLETTKDNGKLERAKRYKDTF